MAKKSGTAIRDFFISLGFDATEVEKGFKHIEKEFSKLQKALNGSMSANIKVQNQRAKADAKSVKATDSKIAAERKLFNLEKSRAKLKERIAYVEARSKAEGVYVKDYYKDQKNAARSKNKERIDLEYDKLEKDFKFYKKWEEGDVKAVAANEKAKQQAQAATQKAKKAAWRADRAEGLRVKARLDSQKKAEQENIKLGERQYELRKKQARANIRARRSSAGGSDIDEKRWLAREKINRLSSSTAYGLRRQGGANSKLGATAESIEYNKKLMQVSNMASTAKTAADFRRLNSEVANLNQSKTRLINKNKELQNSFRATGFTARALQDSLRNLARSYVSVFAIIGGGGMAASTGQDLVALRTTLLAATGSAEEAGKAFEFVRSQALGMGLDLQSSVKGFAQMGVAAKMAGLTAGQTQEIFTGLAEASAAFGMSTVDQERAQRAIVQMMSKNQVMAEELKGQLSESLPSAVGIAAKAMGVTTQELFKMMEQGELIASDFLPKFTKTLRETVREGDALGEGLNTSRVAMARFGTTFKLNILGAFDAGAEGGFATFFNQLTALMENAAPAMRVIGKVVGGLLSFIGIAFRAIYQVWRPVQILLEKSLVGGIDKANGGLTTMGSILESLYRGFKKLAGVVLVPFALAELGSDRLEKYKTGFLGGKIEYPKGSILEEGSGNTLLDMAARYVVGWYASKAETPQTKNEVNIQIQGASLDDDSWVDKMKNAMSDVLQGEYTLNVAGGG